MEKRILLALILSLAVWFGFRLFVAPPPNQTTTPEKEPVAAIPAEKAPSVPPTEVSSVPDLASEGKEEKAFETPLYIATVSNEGGVLKSFKLKRYLDKSGGPTELINQSIGPKTGWPLTLVTGDASLDKILAEAKYVMKS